MEHVHAHTLGVDAHTLGLYLRLGLTFVDIGTSGASDKTVSLESLLTGALKAGYFIIAFIHTGVPSTAFIDVYKI